MPTANDGEIAVEVCLDDVRIGYLRRDADAYYCVRLDGLRSSDPYWLALHLVHPDRLYQVPDEIVAARSSPTTSRSLAIPNYEEVIGKAEFRRSLSSSYQSLDFQEKPRCSFAQRQLRRIV